MSVDIGIATALAGALAAGISAATAFRIRRDTQTDFSREVEAVFRRSRDAAPVRPNFDVFLTYAADDSKRFAQQLAQALRNEGLRIWFDEDQIHVGDNAFMRIGEGLNSSRYGLVILSPHFFEHGWAEQELRALLQRESEEKTMILPVWHGVSQDEVQQYSPELAMKQALKSENESVEEIASDLAAIARPS
jgi:hypothetical protein